MAGDPDVFAARDASIEPVRFAAGDLNPAIRPQDDLDGFVNSRWRAANPVPPEHSCWDCFTILNEVSLRRQADIADAALRGDFGDSPAARIVADFWASGLDEAAAERGLDTLRQEQARIDAIGDRAALADYLRDSHRRGADPLFRIEARPDFTDPQRLIAFVIPRNLSLPDRDDYCAASRDAAGRRDALHTHVGAMLALSAARETPAAPATVADIVAFESTLAEALPARRDLARDIAQLYHPVDGQQADRLAPRLRWSTFFAPTTSGAALFSLALPRFHCAVDALIEDAPLATWRAWLRYRASDVAAAFLGATWRAQHERFHGAAMRGRGRVVPRWKHALDGLNRHAGEAIGELYAACHASPSTLDGVRGLVDELRAALRARLLTLPWMGEDTRTQALHKLAAMRIKVGAPRQWRDLSDLRTTRSGFYANVVAAREFQRRGELSRAGGAVDAEDWSMLPQTVNARYDPQRNELLIPIALLAPPLFAPDADAAMNFGAIGAVIAHEMTHAFDDQGSRFDAAGRLCSWWSEHDRRRFDALAANLVDSIEGWRNFDGERVDGKLTLGENIADFGGLTIAGAALDAVVERHGHIDPLIDGYSQRQRFFLSWAALWRQNLSATERALRWRIDVHAPANVRANAAAANSAAFAAAFACRPGDGMMLAESERVRIW